jgi:lysophospholipase L1-like esterase
MRRVLAASGGVLAVILVVLGGIPADAAPRPNGTLLVIGDSITARYDDVVGPKRGWWSVVAEKAGMKAIVSAESGSGFLMRGATLPDGTAGGTCSGSGFTQRLDVVKAVKPDAIVVAGGRNDFKICVAGKKRAATRAETKTAIATYMRNLSTLTRSLGIPASNVYVASPWGSAYADQGRYIRPWVKAFGELHGFTWLPTGTLASKYTLDGTHPNAAGNVELARRVLERSNIGRRSW